MSIIYEQNSGQMITFQNSSGFILPDDEKIIIIDGGTYL